MSIFNFKKDSAKLTTTETPNAEIVPAQPATTTDAQIQIDPPEQEEQHPAEESTEANITCSTSARLTTYPLIKETVDFVDSVPGVLAVKSSTKSVVDPAVKFVANQPFIKPVVQTVDHLGEQTLSTVESVAPFVKTATYGGITSTIEAPFKKTGEVITSSVTACNDAIEDNVVSPTIQKIHEFRAYYNEHLYDTKGKPLLRSSLDLVFRPINGSITSFAEKNLPEAEPITKQFSSEIERNVHLSADLIQRSIPVVGEKTVEIVMVPCNYAKHALDVFNDNLQKEQEKNIVTGSIIATYNSSLDLVSEAWNESVQVVNKTFGLNKSEKPITEPVEQPEQVEPVEQPAATQTL